MNEDEISEQHKRVRNEPAFYNVKTCIKEAYDIDKQRFDHISQFQDMRKGFTNFLLEAKKSKKINFKKFKGDWLMNKEQKEELFDFLDENVPFIYIKHNGSIVEKKLL